MSNALMIQGTGSGVGKSLIVSGLCRIFSNRGIAVAPFKAQNMALNSFITKEGGEIGRAQALQAEAARIDPSVDMNPVLLKATGEAGCQVIMNGRVHANMTAQKYYSIKKEAWKAVTEAYERLSNKYDLIVIEGAGSPAEINLRHDEIVNMSMARYADAPVILVGDIDKGGVFASFYGTIGLLDRDADYIKAFIVNKFRGDLAILNPGLTMIQEKTGRPVIGVIPYLGDLCLHEEDGIPLERLRSSKRMGIGDAKIRIVVVQLRYIANFTDFDPFIFEPDVEVIYSLREADLKSADLIIIPGSKNTVEDLLFLRNNGIERSIKAAVEKGIPLIGICGGFQMLGKRILDPSGIESSYREVEGLGLLEIETTIEKTKITSQVEARLDSDSMPGMSSEDTLRGYEIHMGRSSGDICLFKLRGLSDDAEPIIDGSLKGNVWGTYIHGIFDNDHFRRSLLNSIRTRIGLTPLEGVLDYSGLRDDALTQWSEILESNLDMKFIESLIKD
jgi:adenosylcobyric acid synthase